MSDKPRVDWEAVEIDYRAGIKSLRMMAEEYGCAESAIRKRAKRDGWVRDLSAKIKAKAEDLVRREEVRSVVRTDSPSERQMVEVGAELQKYTILGHRKDIRRTRSLAINLLEELEIISGNNALLRELAVLMRNPDERARDRMNEIYLRVIAHPERVDSLKKLSDALKVLVGLEREAFGIESKNAGSGLEDASVTNIGISFVSSGLITSPTANFPGVVEG